MTEQLHTHASGATSGELKPPMFLLTWLGVKLTALRFGYGNQKHEKGTTLYAEANWLKAFHARDLHFFRDRAAHAIDHIVREMSGHEDEGPGGNWGAVGWCTEVLPYVKQYDPEFYKAVQGTAPHPGERKQECGCPRCAAPFTVCASGKPEPPKVIATLKGWRDTTVCEKCSTAYPTGDEHTCFGKMFAVPKVVDVKVEHYNCTKCNQVYCPGFRFCCFRCDECCTCL